MRGEYNFGWIVMEEKILSEMIHFFDGDVKRINHAIKVYTFSKLIAYSENLNKHQYTCLIYSSILHDVGIKIAEKKYNSSSGKYQEIEGPPAAKEILEKMKINKEIIKRVCFIIGNHHSYKKIDGIDFRILVEADYLVNAYEDQISARAVEKMKIRLFKTKKGTRLLEQLYGQKPHSG